MTAVTDATGVATANPVLTVGPGASTLTVSVPRLGKHAARSIDVPYTVLPSADLSITKAASQNPALTTLRIAAADGCVSALPRSTFDHASQTSRAAPGNAETRDSRNAQKSTQGACSDRPGDLYKAAASEQQVAFKRVTAPWAH